jgi:hypothetical protein
MKQLRMVNGDVVDAEDIDAIRHSETDDWHEFDADRRFPDAPRDENGDAIFDNES